jgi:hypothetical protein
MVNKETRFADLEEYTTHRVRQDLGMSLEEAIKETAKLVEKDMIPYDRARFGELPELLKNASTNI